MAVAAAHQLTSRSAEYYDVILWWGKCTLDFPTIGTSLVTHSILVGPARCSQREIIEKVAVVNSELGFVAVEQA